MFQPPLFAVLPGFPVPSRGSEGSGSVPGFRWRRCPRPRGVSCGGGTPSSGVQIPPMVAGPRFPLECGRRAGFREESPGRRRPGSVCGPVNVGWPQPGLGKLPLPGEQRREWKPQREATSGKRTRIDLETGTWCHSKGRTGKRGSSQLGMWESASNVVLKLHSQQ